MARGSKSGPNADPRWEGQDSLSLPSRPAHPDPSYRFEATDDPDSQPVHGIHGFVELKHGQVSEAEANADRARLAQAELDSAEESHAAVESQASQGNERAKNSLKGSKANVDAKKSAVKDAGDVDDDSSEAALRDAILSGDVVPSIEAAEVEGSDDGKRTDVKPGNAPDGTGQAA
jgi:hypothetical protein